MLDLDGARATSRRRPPQRLLEPALTITGEGLVFGGTVLAKMERGRAGGPALVLDGGEERVLALLAVVYGEAIDHRVLAAARRASGYWNTGEPVLAAIALAHAGLPPLDRAERASLRLSLAERLLDDGLSPQELVKACDLDPALLDLRKAGYDPDEPRVPAGNPDGGQWTDAGFASDEVGYGPPTAPPSTAADGDQGTSTQPGGEPSAAGGIVFADYKVIKEPPADAKVVIPPDGTPIRGGDSLHLLIAPPYADYRLVYAAGRAIASLQPLDQLLHIRAALRQGGTYDFQRDPIRQETQPAYADASNYAVGVYLAGAGYPLSATRKLAEIYAFFNSSNYGSQRQADWIAQGWHDATAGRWK